MTSLDSKSISRALQKQLTSLKRDGVSAVEAAKWLTEAGILTEKQPQKSLRVLLREGKIKGAYQFPNKRWVIVNNHRLPDGVQRVIPIKETARFLRITEDEIHELVSDGRLVALDFGPSPTVFAEEELRRFQGENSRPSYELGFPRDAKRSRADLDKLKRQLYYLRSDIRLIVERVEELIRLLEK